MKSQRDYNFNHFKGQRLIISSQSRFVLPVEQFFRVMSRGASVGLFRTLPLVAGLVLGDLVLFGLALLGLAALAAALGPYFVLVKWSGVLYLLLLAYRLCSADSVIKTCMA